MLSLVADHPLGFVAPVLVLVTWVTLWISGRRTGPRFYLSAAAVAVLSIPAALLVGLLQGPCYNPGHDTWGCGYSGTLIAGVLSALLTAACLAGLLLLTAFLKIFGLAPGGGGRSDPER